MKEKCYKEDFYGEKDWKTSEEFLSGFGKQDILTPVITIVLYYGEKEWDGSKDLYGLFGIEKNEASLFKEYIPNYHINLVEPAMMEDLSCFFTDLQMIFGMLQYRKDKKGLLKYVKQHEDYFSYIDQESYYAAAVMLGSQKRLESVTQAAKAQKKGGIDMCEALEELYQDGIQAGMENGIKALIIDNQEEGIDKEKIIGKLEKHFALSQEKAKEYFERFKNEP